MSQYMILIYSSEAAWAKMSEAENKEIFGAYMAYTQELKGAGVMRGGDPLDKIRTAKTVRVREGKTTVTDGPFAETKEQLGGYYIVETDSIEKALEWGAKCPGAKYGSIEVRPIPNMAM